MMGSLSIRENVVSRRVGEMLCMYEQEKELEKTTKD